MTTATSIRVKDLTLGLRYHSEGRFDEAEKIYQRLHAADRHDTEVIYLLGVLCCDLGLFEPARKFLEDALALAPAFPEARDQLAVALGALADAKADAGDFDEAQALLERALERAPDNAHSSKSLGRLALLRGNAATAEVWLGAALARQADDAEALNWLGLAELQLGKHIAAETSLRRALRLAPHLNQARNNLGLALQRQGRIGEARTCFEQALARESTYQAARINLANTLRVQGEQAAARRELTVVLAAQPDSVDALNNLGAVLQDLGESELALETLTRAVELAPRLPEVRWNLALTQLQRADVENGWKNFETRWQGCAHLRGAYRLPVDRAWRGESLQGKRLLLWSEQGFGDTIQFIRFAQDVAARGAVVSVLAPPELLILAGTAPGVSSVSASNEALAPYDFHCPLMSLPYLLGIPLDVGRLHGAAPYLSAPQDRVASWRQRLTAYEGLKLGLVWSGSTRWQSAELAAIDVRRSIPLELMEPLLAETRCTFFSLQKGAPSGAAATELGRGGAPQIHDFSADWHDFSDTAAFVANLDLVISVDTAVAHLAGALGKPVWLLNRYDSCWRWLLNRSDSPWYATLRQFRQPRPGDWQAPIAAAAAALAEVARGH